MFLLLDSGCKQKQGISPKVATITESVYASGNIKAAEQYKVISSVPGILLKKHVNVGDLVKQGDPIFTLKNTTAVFALQNSQLAVSKVADNKNSIAELERQLQLARTKLRQDSLMFMRQKNLWENAVGTQVQFEQAQLALKSSSTEYLNTLSQFKRSKLAWQLDYAAAKNNARISRENAEDYTIRSGTTGRIYTIYPEVGEGISTQTVMAVIGGQNSFLIQLQVDENDITRIQPGQEVFVTMDSYKDSVYKASITKIYPIMNENTGTFTVEAIFTKKPARVYPHLNLEANILIREKPQAIIIPREYLLNNNYVMLQDGKRVKVNVGLKNYEYAEIISGLPKNQLIYKP